MSYLAHSARPDQSIPAQGYGEHIRASRDSALLHAEKCGRYSKRFGEMLVATATLAGEFHDFGKLDDANQKVLAGTGGGKLPVPHVDAGAAHLLNKGDQASKYAALICYAHHRGLPSLPEEINRSQHWMRDGSPEWRAYANAHLAEYLRRHRDCVEEANSLLPPSLETNQLQVLWRLALSCQADADHGDTARHYGKAPLNTPPLLRAKERLAVLDSYVAELRNRGRDAPRTELRQAIYQACKSASTQPHLYACDAPVGSGKTTAVMAHLLKAASDKNLRRIFVVLPYTNIITQAVEVYREALALKGENPEEVVAEHHHKADYATPESRRFTMLWHAPIVVTTAVQFFETLASNMPADLRKLHRLPGSAVFLDEAHAALPAYLWPQAWLWLNELSEHWGCHFVFASGSLTRFWELPDFHPQTNSQQSSLHVLPELVTQAPRTQAFDREQKRVIYRPKPKPFDLDGLVKWVGQHPGPRLLIMNTVQSTAVVAREMAKRYGCGKVEHLSTALTPADREITLNHVKQRLISSSDPDWTLVATSCVEAGVDFSFRVGFRERASLMSLIQLGGRVNRGHEEDRATVWDFQIIPDALLRLHPKFRTAARVLGELFEEGKVAPEFCMEALKREIRWDNTISDELLRAESAGDARNADFPKVAELFKVIDSNTVTVVVASKLQEQLRQGKWCGKDELQKHSVQIWGWRVEDLRLEEFMRSPRVYGWQLPYDSFLGYMAGLLPDIEFVSGKPTVI
ncbi:MAG: DEAD/DEAH box helicase [Nitrospirae bacterium]|nr:DEAD/DEAH box helicase [Nitrospirota bacterium]